MSESKSTECVVIGAGPGGYVAAIRLAQLGKKTVVVERDRLGGVCLNWGCIPSKSLIHAANLYESIQHAEEFGIEVEGVSLDFARFMGRKNDVVGRLTGGIGHLLKKNGVEHVVGEARFSGSRSLEITGSDGSTSRLEFESCLIAVGSRSIEIPGFAFDGKRIHSSRTVLDLEDRPDSMVVIGGGVIGLELGTVFRKLGTEVTVIEMMSQLLPGTDPDLVKVVQRELKKRKVGIHLEARATGWTEKAGKATLQATGKKGDFEVQADVVLVSVGRRPNTENLGLEQAGVKVDDRGFIAVDSSQQTSMAGIHAIGDCVAGPLLAHRASKEGEIAAERMAGHPAVYDVKSMPAAVFTDPEIATVGLTEVGAREAGIEIQVGQFPFAASGRALSVGHTEGFVKVIADPEGLLLGAGIVGAEASELIGEMALAIEMGAYLEDIELTVHTHPTLSEGMMEAAAAAANRAIHIVNE